MTTIDATMVELERLQRRHRDYFAGLARRARPMLRRREQVEWLDLLDANSDNLRAALAWSIDAGDVDVALRLVADLGWFWEIRGHWDEGKRWATRALDAAEASAAAAPDAVCGAALVGARLALRSSDQRAGRFLEAAEAVAPVCAPELQVRLAAQQVFRSLDTKVADTAVAAVHVARQLDDDTLLADILAETGTTLRIQSRSGGGAMRKEAFTIYERLGDRLGMAECLQDVAWLKPGPERRLVASEALRLSMELGDVMLITVCADQVCWEALSRGDIARAREVNAIGIDAARRTGDLGHQRWLLTNGALLYAQLGEITTARELTSALDRVSVEDQGRTAVATRVRAIVEAYAGDDDPALELTEQAVALARRASHPWSLAFCLEGLAMVLMRLGDLAGARAAATEAVDTHGAPCYGGDFNDLGRVCRLLTVIEIEAGNVEAAGEWLDRHWELAGMQVMARGQHHATRAALALVTGDVAAAEHALREAFAVDVGENGWLNNASFAVATTLADYHDASGDAAAAVRAVAAGVAFKARAGYTGDAWIWVRREHEARLARLREKLGNDRFEAEWAAGARLSIEDVAL